MSSALSFHCMICFEEFHHADRYPVVLPCGHTYVCHVCAQRLDRCMECRTLLTWAIPKQFVGSNASTTNSKGWSSSRSSLGRITPSASARGSLNPGNAPLTEKKRLPLPKNVVLLSLMEATELASELAQRTSKIDSLVDADAGQELDNEEEKIKLSTSLAVGACGTYVVADKDGLQIYPSRPGISFEGSFETDGDGIPRSASEDEVNALVRFFHLDHKLKVTNSENEYLKQETAPVQLKYGDRVQIVSLGDGDWAKLARGYGYIRANARQLVKVGGSVDKACRLEALLNALTKRRTELVTEQGKIDNSFGVLMQNLQASLFNDEDLTITASGKVEDADGGEVIALSQSREERRHLETVGNASSDESFLAKPQPLVRQPTPPMSGFSCFGAGMLQAISGAVGNYDDDDEEPPSIHRLPPASTVVAPIEMRDAAGIAPSRPEIQPNDSNSTGESVSPRAPHRLSARANAMYQERSRIDFRTGMSGHMGLASYMVHPHVYLEERAASSRAPGLLKMSGHTGLTVSRTTDRGDREWQTDPS